MTLRAIGPASLYPFKIKQVIDGTAGAVKQVKKLSNGDLLVKVNSVKYVKDLQRLKKFHLYDTVASLPVNMNFCRDVIYCKDIVASVRHLGFCGWNKSSRRLCYPGAQLEDLTLKVQDTV